MIQGDKTLIDGVGRKINYLRLSVTDRCNLDCIYCLPSRRLSYLDRDDILGFEEILRILNLFVKLGIKKIRITGGEPLLRKNVLDLIASIRKIENIEKLAITTNGILLKEVAAELKRIGIDSINISLDSLDRNRFKEITGVDALSKVTAGIDEALKVGIKSLKINVVLMGGINETEIIDFINLAREVPVDVRFIEYMPLIEPTKPISFMSANFVLQKIEYP
ncbi:radical SAM protein, partial [bacterium]|nr:radical SAM protein [bacterium]